MFGLFKKDNSMAIELNKVSRELNKVYLGNYRLETSIHDLISRINSLEQLINDLPLKIENIMISNRVETVKSIMEAVGQNKNDSAYFALLSGPKESPIKEKSKVKNSK